MVDAAHQGTGNVPLKLADAISAVANAEWKNGEFFEKVTPTTRDLLRFWDPYAGFYQLTMALLMAISYMFASLMLIIGLNKLFWSD